MKRRNIILVIVLMLIILSFGFLALSIYAAKSVFGCPLYLYNHEEIIKIAHDEFEIQVPETASNLRLSTTWGIDYAYCYFSLTLSDEEGCKQFIEALDVSIADFQRVSNLPEEYRWIPRIWYCGGFKTFKKEWGISIYNEYYVHKTNTDELKIVYVPEHNRIFIIKRVPS